LKTIRVHKHRFINDKADTTTLRALLLQLDTWAVAYGRRPEEEQLAKVGDSTDGRVVGELTLESRAENANAKAYNVTA
jgi:hypothetical protein